MVSFISNLIGRGVQLGATSVGALGNLSAKAKQLATRATQASLGVLQYGEVKPPAFETTPVETTPQAEGYDGEIDTATARPVPKMEEKAVPVDSSTLTLWEKAKLFFTKGKLGQSVVGAAKSFSARQIGSAVGSMVFTYLVSEAAAEQGNFYGQMVGCVLIAIPTLHATYQLTTQRPHHWEVMAPATLATGALVATVTRPFFGEIGAQVAMTLGQAAFSIAGGYAGLQLVGSEMPLLDTEHLSDSYAVRQGLSVALAGVFPAKMIGYYALPMIQGGRRAYDMRDKVVDVLTTKSIHTALAEQITRPLEKATFSLLQKQMQRVMDDKVISAYFYGVLQDLTGYALNHTDDLVTAAIQGFNGFVQIVEKTPEVAVAHQLFHSKPTRENRRALLGALNQALGLDFHEGFLIKEELDLRLRKYIRQACAKISEAETEWLGFNVMSQQQLDYLEGMALLFMATYLPYVLKGLFQSSHITTLEDEQALTRNVVKMLFGYVKQEAPQALLPAIEAVQTEANAFIESCHKHSSVEVIPSEYQPNGVSRFVVGLLKGTLTFGMGFVSTAVRMWSGFKSFFAWIGDFFRSFQERDEIAVPSKPRSGSTSLTSTDGRISLVAWAAMGKML